MIDRDDDMAIKHGFVEAHPEYNKKKFEQLISEVFLKWEYIGEGHHPTRFIYLLTKYSANKKLMMEADI